VISGLDSCKVPGSNLGQASYGGPSNLAAVKKKYWRWASTAERELVRMIVNCMNV
jgi:hypothetical protein